jgi:hypothetical protein
MAALNVLSVSELNIQQYAQGSFSDIAADIRGFIASKSMYRNVLLVLCQEFSVDGAFNLRKELIALKKVLLRLSEKSTRQTRTLSRLTTWFYSDITFAKDDNTSGSWTTSDDYKTCSDAMHLSKGTTISLVEARGVMKCLCCLPRFPREGLLSSFGGPTGRKLASVPCGTTWWKTLKDANSFLSSLDCDRNALWEETVHVPIDLVPIELGGWASLQRIRRRMTELVGDALVADQICCSLIARGVWKSFEMRFQAYLLCRKLGVLCESLEVTMRMLQQCIDEDEMCEPPSSTHTAEEVNRRWMLNTHGKKYLLRLRTSLIVVREINVWLEKLLGHTHVRPHWSSCSFASTIHRYLAHSLPPSPQLPRMEQTGENEPPPTDDHLDNDVSPPKVVWHSSYEPMFQAGDGVLMAAPKTTDMQAMYFPAAFSKIPALVEENSLNVELFFPLFVTAVGSQAWPPVGDLGGASVAGDCFCHCCHGMFSKVWMDIWLNSLTMAAPAQSERVVEECEGVSIEREEDVRQKDKKKRNAAAGSCIEGVCCECVRRFKQSHRCCSQHLIAGLTAHKNDSAGRLLCGSMFCPHRLHCPVHDGAGQGSFSCFQCGIHKGDGGDVQQLCATLARMSAPIPGSVEEVVSPALLLFLDFDRTLCSTKSGADPDPLVDRSSDTVQQTTKYSIDDELREVTRLPGVDRTFVITRNSHGESICRFLAKNDCSVHSVHVVAKKSSGRKQERLRRAAVEASRNSAGGAVGKELSDGLHVGEAGEGAASVAVAALRRCNSSSKAEVILQLMRRWQEEEPARPVVAVYVDDDIQELCEGWGDGEGEVAPGSAHVANADGSCKVHRFLFCRGAI